MKRTAVIGGGYTGTAFAIHLARTSPRPLEIVVVEPRAQVGGGLAHSAADPDHRLNAPDVIHFLYPDDVLHFRSWLERTGRLREDPDGWYADGRLYPRRRDFGAYLSAEFAAHAADNPSGSTLVHARGTAAGLEPRNGAWRIAMDAGPPVEADRCVIAVGQEPTPARLPGLPPEAATERWVPDPFAPDALRAIGRDEAVLVLGTGLTSADTVAALLGQGHRGPITCLSRRGVRPQDQNPAPMQGVLWDHLALDPPAFVAEHGLPAGLRALMRCVRADARRRLERGEPWHGAIDAVRDAAGELWCALDTTERVRFERHLKPFYDGHRFRIPPQTRDILERAETSGQLDFEKGRVTGVRTVPGGLQVTVRPRGDTGAHTRVHGAVVSCAGFGCRVADARSPFVRSVLRQGLARPSDMGRGLDADAACRVVAAGGAPTPGLHVIGSMTLDRFGETPAAVFILRQILRMLPGFVASA